MTIYVVRAVERTTFHAGGRPPGCDSGSIRRTLNDRLSDSLSDGDPDGSIFRLRMSKDPEHGTCVSPGAQQREITYIPEMDFAETDPAYCYAVDDENDSGGVSSPVVI